MSWSDRDWDDWVRGQPQTFWGEEKRRLEDTRNSGPTVGSQPISVAGPGTRSGPERSLEDHIQGAILTVASCYMAYVAYRVVVSTNVEADWGLGIAFGAFMGTAIGGHLILESGPGQKFLRLLASLLKVGLLALIAIGIFYLWRSV